MTLNIIERSILKRRQQHYNLSVCSGVYVLLRTPLSVHEESFGQLVLLGFDVTTFRPVTYQRSSLLRPSMEVSSCG